VQGFALRFWQFVIRKKEEGMPYVNIKITDEGVTKEQKAALIKGVTGLLQDILKKNPATTVVVIDEVKTDNWGIKGEQVTDLRKQPPEAL
jgi:4-oxalocrotonate tautomerase